MPDPELQKPAPLPGVGTFIGLPGVGTFIGVKGHGRQKHRQGKGAAQMPNSDTVFRPGSPDRLPFSAWVERRKETSTGSGHALAGMMR
jgi:hypothetical protein